MVGADPEGVENVLLDTMTSQPPRGGRRRAQKRRSTGSRVVRLLLVLLLVLVLVAGVIFAAGKLLGGIGGDSPKDYPGAGDGSVTVTVPAGASSAQIARVLSSAGVVASNGAFTKAALKDDQHSRMIQAGRYRLHEHMSGKLALAALLDKANRVPGIMVIPGMRMTAIFDLIAKNSSITVAQLQEASTHPDELGLPAYAGGHLEGYLYPGTYDVNDGETATELLAQMVRQFQSVASEIGLESAAPSTGFSPQQLVTIASLIQKESGAASEDAKVSRVIRNRLDKPMALKFDSTVNFATGKDTQQPSHEDFTNKSPYNTYNHMGLPPGPIASPSKAALQAAISPEDGDWLWFIYLPQDKMTHFYNNDIDFCNGQRQLDAYNGHKTVNCG